MLIFTVVLTMLMTHIGGLFNGMNESSVVTSEGFGMLFGVFGAN